jgi:hypothetical protein
VTATVTPYVGGATVVDSNSQCNLWKIIKEQFVRHSE